MKIDLVIEGKVTTFSSPFISGRVLKDTIALANSQLSEGSIIDEMAGYISMVYGKQFTADDVLDGIASDSLIPTFQSTLEGVTGKLNEKLEKLQDPNVKRGKK